MAVALGCAMLVGIGCESTSSTGPSSSGAGDSASRRPAPLDALSRRFGRVAERLRKRGYEKQRSLRRRFAVEGDGVDVPMDLPTGRCTTFAALAGGGMRDLRLTLYDGDGDEAAVDSVEGEGGLLHVCPPQGPDAPPTRPYYLVFQAKKGSGAIVSATFTSAPAQGEGFEKLFEGIVAPRVPLRRVEERLADSRAALRSRGLVPVAEPRLESVAEGEVIRAPFMLEPDRCYVAVARAGTGVEDVDLFLYDPAGAEVARDLESDAKPSLEHCPQEAGRHIVEMRAFEGAGALGLSMLGGPAKEVDQPQRPESDTPDASVPERREEPPDPARALDPLVSRLSARGYASVFANRDVPITPGEVRTHDVLLGPDCNVVVGASVPGMDLDLYLSNPAGETVDRDTRVEPTARVSACPEEASVRRVAVKAYGKRGPYALAVLRAPDDIDDVRALRLEEAQSSFRDRGYQSRATVRASLDEEERLTRRLQLDANHCLALAVAGNASIHDVDVFLRDAQGNLLASAAGPAAWAAVSRCAGGVTETLRSEVVVYRGSGEVAVRRLSKDSQAPPSAGMGDGGLAEGGVLDGGEQSP